MKIIAGLCGLLCATTAAQAQSLTPISNLNQPTGGSYSVVESDQDLAVSFTTDGQPGILGSVAISLAGAENDASGNDPAPFEVTFNADASGSPGSLLTALDGNPSPTNAGIYTYLPETQTPLATNTTYWIVASSLNSINGAAYRWSETTSIATDAGSTWSLGPAAFLNGSWYLSAEHLLFSVSTASPNPPTLAISQPVVLTYTNTGVAYILQQNSNLAATNWVTVTNAILSGVLGNQGVYLLPPGAHQLFFRLKSP